MSGLKFKWMLLATIALPMAWLAARPPAAMADEKAASDTAEPSATSAPIGAIMRETGGSLLRATVSASADADVPMKSASFIAVSEQQPKVLKKEDLVTVIVSEISAFSTEGTSDLQKHSDMNAQITGFTQLNLAHLTATGVSPSQPLGLTTTTDRDAKGTASVDRSDSLTARITARVVDVKPNGTLVLEATKRIKTDEEEQIFTLTGICRADDVAADNTILSTQMYDLSLSKEHTGAVRDTTSRGGFSAWLDKLNPF
jgi:flagellar L-ring protein FlgH